MHSKRDVVLTARANRIARFTVSKWADRNGLAEAVTALPKLYVKHVRRGRTDFSRREQITVPSWAYREYGKHYFRYYVLHETAHAVARITNQDGYGHTGEFHRIEKELCDEWKLNLRAVSPYPKGIDYKGQDVPSPFKRSRR